MLLQIEQLLPFLSGKLDFNQLLILLVIVWVGRQVPSWIKGLFSIFEMRKLQTEALLGLSQNVNKGHELLLHHVTKEVEEAKKEVLSAHALGNERVLARFETIEKTLKIILNEVKQ